MHYLFIYLLVIFIFEWLILGLRLYECYFEAIDCFTTVIFQFRALVLYRGLQRMLVC